MHIFQKKAWVKDKKVLFLQTKIRITMKLTKIKCDQEFQLLYKMKFSMIKVKINLTNNQNQ